MPDFIVARRIVDEEEDVITLEPVCLIMKAPEDETVQGIKEVLEETGEADDPYNARNGKWDWLNFNVVPENRWHGRTWTQDPDDWARKAHAWAVENGDFDVEGCSVFLYDTLVDRIYGEVRVSLRLPQGLHSKLKARADAMSFNSYCLSVLAREVGETQMLARFEAERRKPGRPKKLEVVEGA